MSSEWEMYEEQKREAEKIERNMLKLAFYEEYTGYYSECETAHKGDAKTYGISDDKYYIIYRSYDTGGWEAYDHKSVSEVSYEEFLKDLTENYLRDESQYGYDETYMKVYDIDLDNLLGVLSEFYSLKENDYFLCTDEQDRGNETHLVKVDRIETEENAVNEWNPLGKVLYVTDMERSNYAIEKVTPFFYRGAVTEEKAKEHIQKTAKPKNEMER